MHIQFKILGRDRVQSNVGQTKPRKRVACMVNNETNKTMTQSADTSL